MTKISLSDADQLQLEYAAKTNASVRHVLAELARVQAERDRFRELLEEQSDMAVHFHAIIVGVGAWNPEARQRYSNRIASIRKEAGL